MKQILLSRSRLKINYFQISIKKIFKKIRNYVCYKKIWEKRFNEQIFQSDWHFDRTTRHPRPFRVAVTFPGNTRESKFLVPKGRPHSSTTRCRFERCAPISGAHNSLVVASRAPDSLCHSVQVTLPRSGGRWVDSRYKQLVVMVME